MEEVREQPTIMPAPTLNRVDDNCAMSEVGSQNQEGKLGKFKSVEALMDAYENLQAEFTKKCQLLSQLKKSEENEEKVDMAVVDNQENANSQSQKLDGVEESKEKKNEFSEEGLQEFLSQFGEAKGYEQEIKNNLSSLSKQSDPYVVAWAEVLLKNLKESNASSDPIINQYVLSDEKVRNKILQDYFISLNKSQPPIVISSQSGERLSGVLPDSPKTLADAKKQLEKMFS